MIRIRCLGWDQEPLRLRSMPPDEWARSAAGPGRAQLSVPGLGRLAGWWLSRRRARDQGLAADVEALKERVETLEGSLLGIVRAVHEGLEAAAATSKPIESLKVPPPSAAEPVDTRPISPGEMWALTPEMWGDTVETWAETTIERSESPSAIRPAPLENAASPSWARPPAETPPEPWVRQQAETPPEPWVRQQAEVQPEPWACAPSAAAAEPWSDGAAAGRALSDIRPAALRLAEDGWPPQTIAEKLRLGLGDIQLILKTDLLRPKPAMRSWRIPADKRDGGEPGRKQNGVQDDAT